VAHDLRLHLFAVKSFDDQFVAFDAGGNKISGTKVGDLQVFVHGVDGGVAGLVDGNGDAATRQDRGNEAGRTA